MLRTLDAAGNHADANPRPFSVAQPREVASTPRRLRLRRLRAAQADRGDKFRTSGQYSAATPPRHDVARPGLLRRQAYARRRRRGLGPRLLRERPSSFAAERDAWPGRGGDRAPNDLTVWLLLDALSSG
jgi:hypothetical protein